MYLYSSRYGRHSVGSGEADLTRSKYRELIYSIHERFDTSKIIISRSKINLHEVGYQYLFYDEFVFAPKITMFALSKTVKWSLDFVSVNWDQSLNSSHPRLELLGMEILDRDRLRRFLVKSSGSLGNFQGLCPGVMCSN